jgi:hypothetical protein
MAGARAGRLAPQVIVRLARCINVSDVGLSVTPIERLARETL